MRDDDGSVEDEPKWNRHPGQSNLIQSGEKIAVTAVHQLMALGDQAPGPVLEKLAGPTPFFGHALVAEQRDRDLAIGLSRHALVERDQRMTKALIARKG